MKMMKMMKMSFPPIAEKNAKVLILGTFPSEESLKQNQYYANPRNSFWYIIGTLLNTEPSLSYEDRKKILGANQIALWDVLMSCERKGSLDSSIKDDSIVTNDFESFYRIHKKIRNVFFNGAKAEKEYNKQVLPLISSLFYQIEYARLPSTSPAMAKLTKEEKLSEWAIILSKLK